MNELDKNENNNITVDNKKRPNIKQILITIIPVIISVLSIVTFKSIVLSRIRIAVIIVLTIFFIYYVIQYYKKDKEEQELKEKEYMDMMEEDNLYIDDLEMDLFSFAKLLNSNTRIKASMVTIIDQWHRIINNIIYNIKSSGQINESDWDLENFYSDICCGCKDMLKELIDDSEDKDVLVEFISYYVENGTEYAKMIASSSKGIGSSDIYYIEEPLSDCHYQYGRLMRGKNKNYIIYIDNNEISQNFYKKKESTDLSKYEQYIAIPIYCSKNKLLGVMQVTTKHGKVIMEKKNDIEEVIESYIKPFVILLMLASKIKKILFVQLSQEDC